MTPRQAAQIENFYAAVAMTAIDLGMEFARCTHDPVAIAILANPKEGNARVFLTCLACLNKVPSKPADNTHGG